jgi:pre-rRNA-processing protein TSR1
LKRFRSSPWDAKENLPFDYAKIFQCKNFKRMTTKIVYNDIEEEELDNSVLVNILFQKFHTVLSCLKSY